MLLDLLGWVVVYNDAAVCQIFDLCDLGAVGIDNHQIVAISQTLNGRQFLIVIHVNVIDTHDHTERFHRLQLVMGTIDGDEVAISGKSRKLSNLMVGEVQDSQIQQFSNSGNTA